MKYLIFLFDGLADFPGKRTPLSDSFKPNLDYIASKGLVANLSLIDRKMWSEETRASVSHFANTSFLGYDPLKFYNKRGVLEAISAGIDYKNGWLAIRCDFGTIKNGIVVDRRAGRNTFGLDDLVRDVKKKVKVEAEFEFKRTYGHRAVLVFKKNLSDKIQLNDPLSTNLPPKEILPLDKKAEKSAELVKDFLDEANKILENHPVNEEREKKGIPPANCLLLREAGNKVNFFKPPFTKKHKVKAVAISEPGVMKATCMLAGFSAVDIPEDLDYKKGLEFIFETIGELLHKYDFIYSHIKWTDEAAHDKDFERKKKVIEEFDKHLEVYRDFNGKIVVTTDHITSCETGKHEFGRVPVLIYPYKGRKKVKKFDEISSMKGKKLKPRDLWKILFKSS
ncbi:MAG: hypothetical protein RMJ18_02800 [Candidatus Aenigmarchaeota archaeon]|nr:hypothetical protein [Candidatus Aenigmarchaeota archaeon]MCX8191024.1 hypothetical protein [Candidatus Aenigmarchaeota archaeon]MDW8160320.1 hypothetical protein [Candidatus Aenigmarchaeota archaeon]